MPRYIDADAFIQFVETNESIIKVGSRNGKSFHTGRAVERYYILDLLRNAPTVSPDEVRGVGKWEQKEVFSLDDTTIEQMQSARCSSCGKYHTTPFSYYFSKYNYCPNCGARMKGAEDGTTD